MAQTRPASWSDFLLTKRSQLANLTLGSKDVQLLTLTTLRSHGNNQRVTCSRTKSITAWQGKVAKSWVIKQTQSMTMKNRRREWLLPEVQWWLLMQMTIKAAKTAVASVEIKISSLEKPSRLNLIAWKRVKMAVHLMSRNSNRVKRSLSKSWASNTRTTR